MADDGSSSFSEDNSSSGPTDLHTPPTSEMTFQENEVRSNTGTKRSLEFPKKDGKSSADEDTTGSGSSVDQSGERGKKQKLDTDAVDPDVDSDMDYVDQHDNMGTSSDDASDDASMMNEERELNYDADIDKGDSSGGSVSNETSEDKDATDEE